ncbi:60S ribosomal protein L18a-like protein [Linum perenne]
MSTGEKVNRGYGMPMDNQQESFQGGLSIVTDHASAYTAHPSSSSALPTSQPPYNVYATNSSLPVTGHVVVQRGSSDLPCCGIGLGWFLFILGFILGAIPWYAGACVLVCAKYDKREKTGLIACAIVAALTTALAIILIIISFVGL